MPYIPAIKINGKTFLSKKEIWGIDSEKWLVFLISGRKKIKEPAKIAKKENK